MAGGTSRRSLMRPDHRLSRRRFAVFVHLPADVLYWTATVTMTWTDDLDLVWS
jgi:hypothetical protein